MIRILRLALFPFSILYGLVMRIRNLAYDANWLKSYTPRIKTISVGNLSTGGTGKTPFSEFLIESFKDKRNIAVVSRGYGRKSSGFRWVEVNSDASESGDESLQIKKKFPGLIVAVCENRAEAIQKIEEEKKEIDLIILDDAFQHRRVKAHIYILLTTFKKPYYSDFVLPAGNLRESRSGVKRADFIVMTKCPNEVSKFDQNAIAKVISPKAYQQLYFAKESYGNLYSMNSDQTNGDYDSALLVSGIADNSNISAFIKSKYEHVEEFNLKDHVDYSDQLINRIIGRYEKMNDQFSACIITTEKDAVKLRNYGDKLKNLPVLILPFSHDIEDGESLILGVEDKIMT